MIGLMLLFIIVVVFFACVGFVFRGFNRKLASTNESLARATEWLKKDTERRLAMRANMGDEAYRLAVKEEARQKLKLAAHKLKLFMIGVAAVAVVIMIIAGFNRGNGSQASDTAATVQQPSSEPWSADEEREMQAWLLRHKDADHDDAEAAEEIAMFRWSTKGRVTIGHSRRMVDGTYCLTYAITNHGNRVTGRAYIVRDASVNNNLLLLAETVMSSNPTAVAEWTEQWNQKCRDGIVAKNMTSYLSADLLPATDTF